MRQTADWSHQIELAAKPSSIMRVRDFVCLCLVQHDLLHLLEDVRLVASELTSNAVTHARTPFVVTLAEVGPSVLLTVQDGAAPVPETAVHDPMARNGRGMVIVNALAREWGVDGDGRSKSVWAAFATRQRT